MAGNLLELPPLLANRLGPIVRSASHVEYLQQVIWRAERFARQHRRYLRKNLVHVFVA